MAGMFELQPYWLSGTAESINIVQPLNSRFIPTSRPSIHPALPGYPEKIMAANIRAVIPLASIQAQFGFDRSCTATAIFITPSNIKRMAKSSVSVSTPCIGYPRNMIPIAR